MALGLRGPAEPQRALAFDQLPQPVQGRFGEAVPAGESVAGAGEQSRVPRGGAFLVQRDDRVRDQGGRPVQDAHGGAPGQLGPAGERRRPAQRQVLGGERRGDLLEGGPGHPLRTVLLGDGGLQVLHDRRHPGEFLGDALALAARDGHRGGPGRGEDRDADHVQVGHVGDPGDAVLGQMGAYPLPGLSGRVLPVGPAEALHDRPTGCAVAPRSGPPPRRRGAAGRAGRGCRAGRGRRGTRRAVGAASRPWRRPGPGGGARPRRCPADGRGTPRPGPGAATGRRAGRRPAPAGSTGPVPGTARRRRGCRGAGGGRGRGRGARRRRPRRWRRTVGPPGSGSTRSRTAATAAAGRPPAAGRAGTRPAGRPPGRPAARRSR